MERFNGLRTAAIVGTLAFLLGLTTAAASPALAADLHTGPYGAVWCERIDDLARYVEAIAARDTLALETLQDCVDLKPGVRVAVLEDLGDQGLGPHLLRVRVFGNGTRVDGYTSSGWLTVKR